MAKPYKHATLICLILSILAVIGIVIGVMVENPLPVIFLLFPTVIYEVYRTEGASTKWSSWVLLIVLIAEVVFIISGIGFDIAGYLGEETLNVSGYDVPLGDIKVVAPALMAVLSVILFMRTRGVYTKWLAVIIFITAFVIVYTLDPTIYNRMLGIAVEEAVYEIQ